MDAIKTWDLTLRHLRRADRELWEIVARRGKLMSVSPAVAWIRMGSATLTKPEERSLEFSLREATELPIKAYFEYQPTRSP